MRSISSFVLVGVMSLAAIPTIRLATDSLTARPAFAQTATISQNLLANGDFEQLGSNWSTPWIFSTGGAALARFGQDTTASASGHASAETMVRVGTPTLPASISVTQQGLSLVGGATYSLSFWAKSYGRSTPASAGQSITAVVGQQGAAGQVRAIQSYRLGNGWQQFSLSFTAPVTESGIQVQFDEGASNGTIWLDGVTLVAFASSALSAPPSTATASATNSPVPPSATSTATATNTPIPPSATRTVPPPSATATSTLTIPTASPTGTTATALPTTTATSTTVPPTAATTATPTASATTSPALPATTPVTVGSHTFGTLETSADTAVSETSQGVKVAELTVGWDNYEPQDGVFNTVYAAQIKQKLQAFQAAGMQVVLGIGLHYPPAWVFSYPNSRYVDQYGVSAGEVNLVFNQTLRDKAQALITRVSQDLGLNNFSAVRITSGGDAEVLYPSETADGAHSNEYWAYDPNAQGGASRPATIPAPPLVGWIPGATTYNGQPVTTTQVQQWYGWYVGALVDSVNWQLQTYRNLGYTGYFQILTPGQGTRPGDAATSVNAYLNGTGDGNGTMGRGAAWNMVYAGIGNRTNVVAYISSVGDGSGGNDLCQASDRAVSLTNPIVNNWSGTRWISYIADTNGLLKSGENPGAGTAGYGSSMMLAAMQQMQACGLQGLMWAHDSDLSNGTGGISLQTYAADISLYK